MHPVISRTWVTQLTEENRAEAHYLTWGKWLQTRQSPPQGSFGHIPGSLWCEPRAAEKCRGSECTHRSTWWRGWGKPRDFTCWQSVFPLSTLCSLTEMKSEVEIFASSLSHPPYTFRQSHDQVNVSATFPLSNNLFFSAATLHIQKVVCTCIRHQKSPLCCLNNGGFVKSPRPQLEENQQRSGHGEEWAGWADVMTEAWCVKMWFLSPFGKGSSRIWLGEH